MVGSHQSALESLTPRQVQILDLVSRGLTNQDICDALGISRNTVKIHVAAVIKGLQVSNRTEAATLFQRLSNEGADSSPEVRLAARIGRPAIAVLPFHMMADDDPGHLADGLAEDLITRLSGWRWFPVIAYASSRRFSAENFNVAELRTELGASYLITGSIRWQAGHARINVHLIETQTGQALWSDAYSFDDADTLRTQEAIAKKIVSFIAPELLELEGRLAPAPAGSNFSAWQSTMSGLWHLARRTEQDVQTARQLFEAAITEEPSFALAWFGMVWVHHHGVVEQWVSDPEASLQALSEAAQTCYGLDRSGAAGQTVMGLKELIMGDAKKAAAYLERAAHLNPSSTQALGLLGQCHCLSGKADEAIAAVEEALSLNPYNPNAWAQKSVIALSHFAARRYPEAIAIALDAVRDRPQSITGNMVLVACHTELDDLDAATQVFRQLQNLRPSFDVGAYLSLITPSAFPENINRLTQAFTRVRAAAEGPAARTAQGA